MKNTALKALAFAIVCTLFFTIDCRAEHEKTETPKSGNISGRIIDESMLPLPGASITVEGTQMGGISDVNGFYRINGLEPGVYTLIVSYIGYESQTMQLELGEKTVEKDFKLHEGIALKEVVVSGYASGQNKALNQQKSSINITNVVSADQVGRFPDANIGDALKRIPGVNVQYDQGEARFGHVRGTPPEFNSVTLNGDRVPSAEAETRSVQLDLVPSDMIQTIEVNKVVTPDMEADAIGGSINLVTKSNPYKRRMSATLGGGWNYLVDEMQYNVGALYGDRFKTGEQSSLGMIVSMSYQKNDLGSHNIEAEWDKDDDGKIFMNDFQQRTYYVMRARQSYSASLDYKFNSNHKLELKGIYNRRKDWENRYRLQFKNIKQKQDGSWMAEIRRQTKGGVRDTKFRRLEDQKSMDFALKGEHHLGAVEVKWKTSYAKASEERPNERYITLRAKKVSVNPDLADTEKPFVTVLDKEVSDLSKDFSLKELTEEFQFTDEIDKNAKLDVKIPVLKGAYASKLKIGGRYKSKEKQRDNRFYEYEPKDEERFLAPLLRWGGVNQTNSDFLAGEKYKAGHFVSTNLLGQIQLDNSALFEKEENLEEEAGNYEATEEVTAAYLRYDQELGESFKIIAGLRMEKTDLEYSGRELLIDEKGDIQGLNKTKKRSSNYTDFLPSIIAKYKFGENTQLKFAWTNTMARPRYYDLTPHSELNLEDMKINIGNPELEATHSMNLDLMAEHYFKSLGMVSAGIFYKDITDFIIKKQLRKHNYNGREWKKFVQPINGGDAKLYGVEVAFQRNLDFLPGFLKNLGVYANYTYTKSEVENFQIKGRESESLSLSGTPENTFNASLYYEAKKLTLRASLNYADAFIDEFGESAFYDRYYDKATHLDLNANFAMNKKVNIYIEANNVLNQPLRYYQGVSKRTMQEEYYGVRLNFGLKVNL